MVIVLVIVIESDRTTATRNPWRGARHGFLVMVENDHEEGASHWLKEAYALRQFLPDQGKSAEALL